MKLPALWIVVSFAAGIAIASRWPGPLNLWLAGAVTAMLLGAILLWCSKAQAAWALALVAWVALGGLAICMERAAVPANNVTRLIGAGRLEITEPLRWQGRLREDPMALPWGRRYEIDLEHVEVGDATVPVSGGLRLNLYGAEHFEGVPRGLRAGDRVQALVRARQPRNFLDPGAFDERAYLARQKIDLTGSLRSGELLQLIDRPRPTFSQRLARVRGTLLARLDALFPGEPQRAAVLRAIYSATAALSIRRSSPRFRRRLRTTCSSWRACMWARSSCSFFGSAAGCDSRSLPRA